MTREIQLNLPSFEDGFDMSTIKSTKLYTNCFMFQNEKILLGLKKRGFGANKYNGFGGKVDVGETIVEAAIREVKEEANVTILEKDIKKIGILQFAFRNRDTLLEAHIFISDTFTGDIQETEEMAPKFFNLDSIPYDKMWSDDYMWFDYMLQKQTFIGKVYFDEDEHTILACTLEKSSEI